MLRQIDLRFKLDDRYWSERYYFDATQAQPGDTMDTLVLARMELMAQPTVLLSGVAVNVGDRSSRVEVVYNRDHVFQGVQTVLPLAGNKFRANYPDESVGIAWKTARGPRRMLWLAGIPHQFWVAADMRHRVLMEFLFIRRVQTFTDALRSEPLNLQIRQRKQPPDVPSAVVATVGVAADGLYQLATSTDHGIAAGTQVAFLGTRGNNLGRLRGERRVRRVPDGRTLVLDRGPLPEKGAVRYTGGATVEGIAWEFAPAIWRPLVFNAQFSPPILFIPGKLIIAPFVIRSRRRGGAPPAHRGRRHVDG